MSSSSSSSNNNSNSSNCSLVNTHTHTQTNKYSHKSKTNKTATDRAAEMQMSQQKQKGNCLCLRLRESVCVFVCAYMQKLFFKSNKKQAAIDKDCNNKVARHKNNAQWNQTRWSQVATRRATINMHITNSKLCCVFIDWLSISAALINTDMSESERECVLVLENYGMFGHTVRQMPLPGTNQSNKFQKCHIAHMKNVLVTAPNANRRQQALRPAIHCVRERRGEYLVYVCASECVHCCWLGLARS